MIWQGTFFPRVDTPLPKRHLGLMQFGDSVDLEARLGRVADAVKEELAEFLYPVRFSDAAFSAMPYFTQRDTHRPSPRTR